MIGLKHKSAVNEANEFGNNGGKKQKRLFKNGPRGQLVK